MCATIFGSGIEESVVLEEDIGWPMQLVDWYDINYEEQSATVSCTALGGVIGDPTPFKAIHRPGIGCTLVDGISEADLRAQPIGDLTPPPRDESATWPLGEGFDPVIGDDVDMECLQRAVDEDFANNLGNVRAIAISHRGSLIFEQYAPTVTKDSPLIGWSVTKSLTNAFVGIVSGEGGIDIKLPAAVPEWQGVGDQRANITVDSMLKMQSGTDWNPAGDIGATVICMYGNKGNCANWAAELPLVAQPDTVNYYNSGSTYILSRLALENRADQDTPWPQWMKEKLFWPIGAYNSYIEADANGAFLGGAFGYLTARDWVRYGNLFLNDGLSPVDGSRVLPEGWVDYSLSPSETSNSYGAQWRIDAGRATFAGTGFRDERLTISFEKELSFSRLAMPGLIQQGGAAGYNGGRFEDSILQCFE
jgi:CubicO group peptidase (beta-lactamase class C family)